MKDLPAGEAAAVLALPPLPGARSHRGAPARPEDARVQLGRTEGARKTADARAVSSPR